MSGESPSCWSSRQRSPLRSRHSQRSFPACSGFTPTVALDRQAPELTEVNIPGGLSWSVQGARFFTAQWGVEGTFSQQRTSLEIGTAAGADDLYTMTLARIEASVVYQFGDGSARLRPFVFGSAGTTLFSARDLESEAKPAFSLGAGVKYFRWKTVGLRGQFNYKPTWLNDDPDGTFCAPFGFCQSRLQQVEITAGGIIRF